MKPQKMSKMRSNKDIMNRNKYSSEVVNLTSNVTPKKKAPFNDLVPDILGKNQARKHLDRHEIMADVNFAEVRSPMGDVSMTPRIEGPGSHFI